MTEPRIRELDDATLFYSGPAEFLCERIAENLKLVSQFVAVFGERIESYMRMDIGIRELPALRIYNTRWSKDAETWYINGDVNIDIMFPASLRREFQQKYSDTVVAAVCQQFRRPSFFETLCDEVPGLNELGKTMEVERDLMFSWENAQIPMTQIRLNFRLLLNDWDDFLTSDDRTVDDPFEKTLGDLETITSIIEAIGDDGNVNVTVEAEQDV